MTQDRARELLAMRNLGSLPCAFPRSFEMNGGTIHPQGITREEDAEIGAQWDTMPGSASYYNALLAIANRNLYAAAPDLLEACKAIIKILDSEKRGGFGDGAHMMRFCRNPQTPHAFGAIRAAIAKAEGA